MQVIVIGAGLSGLTAAWRLQQAGHQVVVLEAADQAGGRCKAVCRDGFLIDTCPELVASSYRRWLALVDELGLGADLVKAPSALGVLRDGRMHAVDPGRPWQVLCSGVLSVGGKLQLLAGMLRLRGQARSVPPALMDALALDDAQRNARQVCLQYFGREVSDNLLEPLLRPIGGGALSCLSTALVPYVLAEWAQMLSLRGGLQQVPLALASRVPVRHGCRVRQVHEQADGVCIELGDGQGSGSLQADACVIATQLDDALALHAPLHALLPDGMAGFDYLRMIDIKLAYRVRPDCDAGLLLCPLDHYPDINVISLSHNKCDDRAPDGMSLFSLFTEHGRYAELAALDDAVLVERMAMQLETVFPELAGQRLFSRIARQPRTCMLPTPGYFHRARALWDGIDATGRVHLAGDVFNFGSLEAAVHGGEVAAQRLLASPHAVDGQVPDRRWSATAV